MRSSLLALSILCAASQLATAQPAGSASAEADTLFDQGRTLMDAGSFAEACAAFDASQKISPAISTLFNQAHCREQNSQFATAYGLFREAERQTRAPNDDATQKLNRVAIDRAKQLEPRLSKLTIVVPADSRIPGLEIVRGTGPIDPGAWNHPLPVDGGRYQISARAPDHEAWTATVELLPEGDAKTVEVPRLVRSPEKPSAHLAKRSKLVPVVVAGGALALLGGALGSELWARSDYAQSQAEPDDARQASLFHDAKTRRYIAQGLAVAGVGTAGVAVWLYLRGARGERQPAPLAHVGKFEVEPVVTNHHTGLQLVRNF